MIESFVFHAYFLNNFFNVLYKRQNRGTIGVGHVHYDLRFNCKANFQLCPRKYKAFLKTKEEN
ncbi:hypothetical protein DRW41_21025 [Neobacillus piezotolerans]|uniref:Uncharacterized protein n=1 Tax=Neobacillus piezotolerans TaxID=2259171 RepID=A0A3D8GKH2_9BACI|nr:hypothetical protein DRW41_21025 [Neobacillus piezotolerans]